MSASDRLSVIVLDRQDPTPDTMVLTLADPDNKPLPAFDAGAHVDVCIGETITRQYSLCGDPGNGQTYRLGILKDKASRGGSQALHGSIETGSTLAISLPRNLFPLAPDSQFSVLVGGGIGITPMIAMAYQLHAAGRPFHLHYCVTVPEAAAFAADLTAAPFRVNVSIHYDTPAGKPGFDPAMHLTPAAAGGHLYTCGPSGFMDWVLGAARQAGYAADHLHKEDFSAEVDTSGAGFAVEARASGVTVDVAEGETIAQALMKAGVPVDVSCEEGICGACLTDVLEGEIDHRDIFLTDEEKAEGDVMTVCCSRALSARLVLDI